MNAVGQSRWDTVVIGSGIGGLVAAVALARAGQRVLVLEQHYLPGGWTQSFSLEGHRFSPGVHYIGDLHRGGGVRQILEGLGLGADLAFRELNPDGFDHLLIAGERIDQPRGLLRWQDRLCTRFPDERAGIARYFAALQSVTAALSRLGELPSTTSLASVLAIALREPSLLRYGFRSAGSLLDACVRDPLLRAFLSAQAGNHGLALSDVSLPVHAAMSAHYWNGAFYPVGGARRLPMACIKALRRHGGDLMLRSRVSRILVERGRATGVELAGGERIAAGTVLANCDPAVTRTLLPGRPRRGRRMSYSVSLLSVFCAVDLDLRAMGCDSGNYWWYRNTDVDGLYRRMAHSLPGAEVDGFFLTVTTLKDPDHDRRGQHVLEIFTFVPWEPFAAWSGTRMEERPAEYERLKADLTDKLLAAAEEVIPGLRAHLTFRASGTPLTALHYCESHRGAIYGVAKTPFQVGPLSHPVRTSTAGLYQCGASTVSHGVGGAAISGVMAARDILGRTRMTDCLAPEDGSLRIVPHDADEKIERARARGSRRRADVIVE
jgi:phytoene dehydrogenase-like protein